MVQGEGSVGERDDREAALGWLREPPGADEIRVLVECGDSATLSADARQALEQLMNELNDAEVHGYRLPGSFGPSFGVFGAGFSLEGSCGKLQCDKNDCASLDCGVYSSKFM
jgi:hypothetical protein